MSIEPGSHYKITNVQSGLVLHLADDDQSIVSNVAGNTERQVWIPAVSFEGLTFKSLQTGQTIGAAGSLEPGANLVVGDPGNTKEWVAILAGVSVPLKFGIAATRNRNLVIGLPSGNPPSGSPVSLSVNANTDNQHWFFTKIDQPED